MNTFFVLLYFLLALLASISRSQPRHFDLRLTCCRSAVHQEKVIQINITNHLLFPEFLSVCELSVLWTQTCVSRRIFDSRIGSIVIARSSDANGTLPSTQLILRRFSHHQTLRTPLRRKQHYSKRLVLTTVTDLRFCNIFKHTPACPPPLVLTR